jgi:hypothetical protein
VRPIKSAAAGLAEVNNGKLIQLSARQLMYLRNTNFLPETLAALIQRAALPGVERYVLKVAPRTARQFCSAFTDRLAKLALDIRYDPTTEGVMLEHLIGCFSDS